MPLYNVIADLVGTEKPDEYVYVGGHIDSWDGAQGTVDNGTGVATTIEAARLLVLAGAKPKRTIRFALWSGEEQGLLGSRAYVEAHPELWPKISAVLIHDGGTNYLSGLNVTPQMQPAMEAICAPLIGLNPELDFELRVLEEGRGLPGGGSDHQSFIAKGVPGFFWNQSGRSNYRHHHHTQHDNFDAAIPEYQEHSAIVAALCAFQIANQPELLERTNVNAPSGRGGPRRRLGARFEDTTISEVIEGGKAAEAGWKVGDVLLSIDGSEVADPREIFTEMRRGEAKKLFKLKRGEDTIESTIDFGEEGGQRPAPREGPTERQPAQD